MEVSDDRMLLDFNNYEDYLDSFLTKGDLFYLQSTALARKIVEFGYRTTTEILNKKEFESRRTAILDKINPRRKQHILYSYKAHLKDHFLRELADRERSNRVGLLSTIIFLRHFTKSGNEVSGYIDFEHSLRRTRSNEEGAVDWVAVFNEKRRLWPSPKDLGFYHWRRGASATNDTPNYKVLVDPVKGLTFLNRHDRKIMCPNPLLESPGSNTTRIVIFSDNYEQVIFYDHVVRQNY